MQTYRSGHNGADSKSVWGNPREFESHRLRQIKGNRTARYGFLLFLVCEIRKGQSSLDDNNSPVDCYVGRVRVSSRCELSESHRLRHNKADTLVGVCFFMLKYITNYDTINYQSKNSI